MTLDNWEGVMGRRGAVVAFWIAWAGKANRQLRAGHEDRNPFLAELSLSQVALRIQFFLFKMEIFLCKRR